MQKDDNVREQMFSMITCWQQSGLSQKAYCQQNGIRYHVFHYWYKCFRDRQSPSRDEGFMPIKIQSSNTINTASAHAELVLPDGKRLLFHQGVSSDFLKALIS
ncbi:MAG: IS66 family insertion sequence element accessory protein TnpB [Segetibacter sp.]|jgi:deoxyribodipyrimidine photolyase|nr:IS66 family insertion sequence element accessory protein TnpB [Segetibacter sp.]